MRTHSDSATLRDSRDVVGDPEGLKARSAEDGYVFVPGLLDAASVRVIGRTALSHLQEAGWTEPGADPVAAAPRRPVRAVRMLDAFADPGYRRVLADPGFNAAPFASALHGLVVDLLGPSAFCYPLKVPRIVYPASLVPRQPGGYVHKDYRAVQDMLTCWVPLGEVPRSLGGLAVLPGSQHSSGVAARPLRRLEPGWRTADYEPGDILVFHCLTTHAALPNRQARMRVSAEYRFQRAAQPAPRRMVLGPHGVEMGSRLFSAMPWWRPVPCTLALFDDGGDRTRASLPAPPSHLVTFAN